MLRSISGFTSATAAVIRVRSSTTFAGKIGTNIGFLTNPHKKKSRGVRFTSSKTVRKQVAKVTPEMLRSVWQETDYRWDVWKSHWTITIRGKTRCVLLHFDSSKRCVCPLYKFLYAFKVVKLFLKHPVCIYNISFLKFLYIQLNILVTSHATYK